MSLLFCPRASLECRKLWKIRERQMSQAKYFDLTMALILLYFLKFNHFTGHTIPTVHVPLEIYLISCDILRRVSWLKGKIICGLRQLLFLKGKFVKLISLHDDTAKQSGLPHSCLSRQRVWHWPFEWRFFTYLPT